MVPITTIQPAMGTIACTYGTINVPDVIPNPTAKDTSTPTIHIITPSKLVFAIFIIYLLLFFNKYLLPSFKKNFYSSSGLSEIHLLSVEEKSIYKYLLSLPPYVNA